MCGNHDIGKYAEVLKLILAVLECNLRANLIRKKITKIKIERTHNSMLAAFWQAFAESERKELISRWGL